MAIELTGARVAGSNTCTVLAPAQVTKACSGDPAKATSAGASSVLIVATTAREFRSITLTESEIWLTTQTSSAVRNRTVTGSTPTSTLPEGTGTPELRSNNSRRASGRLQTANRLPSGLNASGCTGGVSKLTNELVDAADPAISSRGPSVAQKSNILSLDSGFLMLVWARTDLAVAMPDIANRPVILLSALHPDSRVG